MMTGARSKRATASMASASIVPGSAALAAGIAMAMRAPAMAKQAAMRGAVSRTVKLSFNNCDGSGGSGTYGRRATRNYEREPAAMIITIAACLQVVLGETMAQLDYEGSSGITEP